MGKETETPENTTSATLCMEFDACEGVESSHNLESPLLTLNKKKKNPA